MEYDKQNLNGWALPEEAFEWILKNIPKGSTILELGSGSGTKELVKYYTVYSVEQDVNWMNKEPKSKYIYAPLVNGWYHKKLFNQLPKKYDLLIVDGPIKKDRCNFTKFCHKFNNVPFLIDDTQREDDRKMALEVAKILNKKVEEVVGHKKKFIILT
jgi:hypothetical protein